MESWGLKVITGKYAGASSGRYAGTIKQRLKDFQESMDDPEIKAILCSRGGYGAIHLIEKLDFTLFREHPKWVIGFSDITALHNLIQFNGFASLHAPMARHLTVEPEDDPCTLHLKNILSGKLPEYCNRRHVLNKLGTARGVLRGGQKPHSGNYAPIPSDTKENQLCNLSPEQLTQCFSMTLAALDRTLDFINENTPTQLPRIDYINYLLGYFIFHNEVLTEDNKEKLLQWMDNVDFTNKSNSERRDIFTALIT